jgi:hypothetical protein
MAATLGLPDAKQCVNRDGGRRAEIGELVGRLARRQHVDVGAGNERVGLAGNQHGGANALASLSTLPQHRLKVALQRDAQRVHFGVGRVEAHHADAVFHFEVNRFAARCHCGVAQLCNVRPHARRHVHHTAPTNGTKKTHTFSKKK